MDMQINSQQKPSEMEQHHVGVRNMRETSRFTPPSFSGSRQQPQGEPRKKEPSRKIISFLEGMITFSLGALFFGVPLFLTGLTFQGLAFEKQIFFYVFMLLLLVAWTSKGVITGEMKIRRTPLDIPIIIFLAVYIIATFFSIDRWHSFWGFFGDPSRGLMSVIAIAVVYFIVVSHYTFDRMIKVLGALSIANFISVVWAFVQIMGVHIPGRIGQFVPASTIGSLSGLGIFLAMMLPVLVTLILHLKSEKSKWRGILAVVALAFLLVTLLLNLVTLLTLYAFVSWSGVLIGASIFLIYILAQIVRPSENWTWVPMVVFVGILAILMIGSNSIARVTLPIEVSPSYKLSWQVAKDALHHSFLIGSGPATYGTDFSQFHPKDFNLETLYNIRFYQGTGLFFESLATLGVLGTIAFLLIILTFVGSGVHMLSTEKQKNKLYSLGLFSASLIVLVNTFADKVEGPMVLIGALLGSLAMAVLLAESDSEQSEKYLSLSLVASPRYALALAFVFMVVSAGVVFLFVFIGKVFIADLRAGSAIREPQISENGSIAKLATAIGWYNRESRYYTRMGQEYLILANQEALKSENDRNINLIRQYLQSAILLAKQGRDMMPQDALAQETLAQTYENAGLYVADAFTMSADAYKKALEIESHNPVYMVKLGQIALAQGTLKNNPDDLKSAAGEAKNWYQKAIDEKQNFAEGYYQLSLSQEVLGDKDGAIASMEKAVSFDNSNANYVFNLARLHQSRGNSDDMKIAEQLYQTILAANSNDANAHFSLGYLYEKEKKNSDAIAEYKKVLDLIPQDQKDTRDQLNKMISNVSSGIPNNVDTIKGSSDQSQSNQNPPLIQGGSQ